MSNSSDPVTNIYRRSVRFRDQNCSQPRKILVSKNWKKSAPTTNAQSSSTGKIKNTIQPPTKPRKITKSDQTVQGSSQWKKVSVDCCKNCGDSDFDHGAILFDRFSNTSTLVQRQAKADEKLEASTSIRYSSKTKQTVQQYYRNENFHRSTESIQEDKGTKKKSNLTTINEAPEQLLENNGKSSTESYYLFTDSSEGTSGSEDDSLEDIKEFRDKNFFECHNSHKSSATSQGEHKCVYRFYLNDRLFPVPLCTDHQNNIRCVECLLPLKENSDSSFQNGAIQTKVKIDSEDEPVDMTLFLPVKDSLIIRERRLERNKPKEDEMYFGVVKLGDRASCKSFLPTNSLALRYQKGYTELKATDEYKFEPITNEDVIVI